jgi:uncharacterized protein DUF3703
MSTENARRRWDESRKHLQAARAALSASRFDEAIRLFKRGHDLGDDNVLCHARGHLGLARVAVRRGRLRAAAIDVMFALAAVVSSPLRRFKGVRGPGFGAP